jgi:DNA-binding NtrC family response regulator/tetratricopeptide (TPR) repeat protein
MNPQGDSRAHRPAAADPMLDRATELERLIAIVDLDLGFESPAQALERLQAYLEGSPDLSPEDRFVISWRMARCLVRLGKMDEGRNVVRAALDDAPRSTPTVERARALLVAAKAALELGHLPSARADATAALEAMGDGSLQQEAGQARNLLGTAAMRSGQPDLAKEHFEKALEVFRKIGDLQRLAGCYMNLHKLRCDWERAAEHYNVAYYLGTTLGEHTTVAGAAQNLGIVLSKTGRYGEAKASFERGLKMAIETGDATRTLRARLALAKLSRAMLLTDRARAMLRDCRPVDGQQLPEREHCLLLLEEARLNLVEQRPEDAEELSRLLRVRVEAMAPRGDLMVEVLLLEADMAASDGRWEVAGESATRALELARDDRDRAQEERALLRLATVWARTGRLGEAGAALAGLCDRHRGRGEMPALASAHGELGRIALDVQGDPEVALMQSLQAAEVLRRIDAPRPLALVESDRAECLIRIGRTADARAQLDSLRRLCTDPEPFPILARRIAELDEGLRASEGLLAETEVPDGLEVHERLEGILAAAGSAWERLPEILSLLREALDLDAAMLARPTVKGLEIIASSGVESDRRRRASGADPFGLEGIRFDGAAPKPIVGAGSAERPVGRLTIPISVRGRAHLLHLERKLERGRVAMSRAERNYAMLLAAEITRALDLATQDPEERRLTQGIALADVITQNAKMIALLELIRRIGDTDLCVLLQGETGTGKKLFAHAIHRASARRGRPIVTVDCAALPDSLLEAELFGYRKGAFTGATQDRNGLLAEATGGTIFLDEIDKSGISVQRRFLHLLDSGEIRPVGSTSYMRLDVRIICATSCSDLRTEVAEGRFLKDLYYRLNDISIEIPPLRDRHDDILLLAGSFVESFAAQAGRRIRGMSSAFRRALLDHDWPGNVRELEKAVRRAVTLADDDTVLTPDLLPREVLEGREETAEPAGDELRSRVELFERRAIERALQACDGNKSRAAALLGLSRKGLKGKMARFRIGRTPIGD